MSVNATGLLSSLRMSCRTSSTPAEMQLELLDYRSVCVYYVPHRRSMGECATVSRACKKWASGGGRRGASCSDQCCLGTRYMLVYAGVLARRVGCRESGGRRGDAGTEGGGDAEGGGLAGNGDGGGTEERRGICLCESLDEEGRRTSKSRKPSDPVADRPKLDADARSESLATNHDAQLCAPVSRSMPAKNSPV